MHFNLNYDHLVLHLKAYTLGYWLTIGCKGRPPCSQTLSQSWSDQLEASIAGVFRNASFFKALDFN
jgi:hypothetical protein